MNRLEAAEALVADFVPRCWVCDAPAVCDCDHPSFQNVLVKCSKHATCTHPEKHEETLKLVAAWLNAGGGT
jgi:hypothetical protein